MNSSDLKYYAAANRPLNDDDPIGGAIDLTTRILTTTIFNDYPVTVVSTSASDTQRLVIYGRDKGGYPRTENITLNGITSVIGKTIFDTILEVRLVSIAIGTITIVNDDGLWYTIAIGEKGATSLFKYVTASEGQDITRYDKLFIKNTFNSDLTVGTLELTVDGSNSLQIGFSGFGGSLTSANRLTAPSGITFADGLHTIGTLSAGNTIGVWIKQLLLAGSLPDESDYTLNIVGTG